MMFVAAGALVIAVALLVGPLAGALGLVLVCVGLWRAWGLWQSWRETGSEPR